ncbi:pitrilysin family protein [Mucilaginibacter sp. UR6-11]|uniref:M16 family metallopeptidase n=1 Tax=Mucilaginibacter sp. UR6-11 TaxID=1435644 RepID=UPI001E4B1FB2|nr:pitrilysin family protein [Mucilaginibacter sp. UR6-11]MCC8424139.1 insulinase family protein [Mucilaginibacter sp. UR6-11]
MKSLLNLIIALLISITTLAQQTNNTTSFDVGGIKVIFKPSQKKIINVRVYYRGGIANFPASKAGIEYFALNANAQCGSKNYSANAQKDTCDKYGIFLSGGSSFDYGYVELNCITKYFNQGWDVFADAVTAPAYQVKEVNLLRNRIIANNRALISNPLVSVSKQLVLNAFKGTLYSFDPYGTDETLNGITDADLKSYYYNTLFNRERMFIVVVGNVTKDELKEKILLSFGNIPSKQYNKPDYDQPDLSTNKLIEIPRAVPINYVSAIANSPLSKSPDFIPFRLGVAALGGNMYYDLVTKNQLVNNVGAFCLITQMPYANLSFITNKPKEAISRTVAIIKEFQTKGINDEWLTRIKNGFVVSNFMNQQNAAAVTDNLGLAEINSGWQYADDFPQLIFMATPAQVNAAINKYITGLSWSYLGNPDAIAGYTIPPL